MQRIGCPPVFLFLLLLILLPFVFAQVLVTALVKLRLDPGLALLIIAGILLGSVVNIPVTRIVRPEDVGYHPLGVFGLFHYWPQLQRMRRETVIAVNVGGCLIPAGLALYETVNLVALDWQYVIKIFLAVGMNIGICYWLARPVEGMGIAIPAFIPPITAVLSALLLAPEEAPAMAFVAGVLGPLIGADLFHLRDIPRIATGMASIGGAGTFDGIVLSGILAAYLA